MIEGLKVSQGNVQDIVTLNPAILNDMQPVAFQDFIQFCRRAGPQSQTLIARPNFNWYAHVIRQDLDACE
ncbi:MAG: hypothetical protein JXQ89_17535 [Pelagimonas sp.]